MVDKPLLSVPLTLTPSLPERGLPCILIAGLSSGGLQGILISKTSAIQYAFPVRSRMVENSRACMINGWSHIAFMYYLVGVSLSQSLDGDKLFIIALKVAQLRIWTAFFFFFSFPQIISQFWLEFSAVVEAGNEQETLTQESEKTVQVNCFTVFLLLLHICFSDGLSDLYIEWWDPYIENMMTSVYSLLAVLSSHAVALCRTCLSSTILVTQQGPKANSLKKIPAS